MTTQEILQKARDSISSKSAWCTGIVENLDGQYCAMGAIAIATTGDAWNVTHPKTQLALKALAAVLPNNDTDTSFPEGAISVFNNTRGHECVLAAFDAAILKAEGDHNA